MLQLTPPAVAHLFNKVFVYNGGGNRMFFMTAEIPCWAWVAAMSVRNHDDDDDDDDDEGCFA
jgi:hypothetical protein